jgi:hypothetical protein
LPDAGQLALEFGVSSVRAHRTAQITTKAQASTNRDASASRTQDATKALAALAAAIDTTDDGVARARVLLALQLDIESALSIAIADAHRQLSWRMLSADLGIPLQTLHRRYGGEARARSRGSR